jgi:ATP/maltotriose-dependent transcriptional regulator MalT
MGHLIGPVVRERRSAKADLQQLEAERLELVDYAVQRALVAERADQQRVPTASARGQRRERLHHRRADRSADPNLVAPRLAAAGRSLLRCHAIRVGVRGISAHRIVRTNPEGPLLPFPLRPAPALLERHSRLRTTHASLISEILNLLAGRAPAARPEDAEPLREELSETELRVLRYLPTNLRGPEIASELFVSLNTIRAHLRNVYAKLGVHSRADAVNRARELGLLAPSSLKR